MCVSHEIPPAGHRLRFQQHHWSPASDPLLMTSSDLHRAQTISVHLLKMTAAIKPQNVVSQLVHSARIPDQCHNNCYKRVANRKRKYGKHI